MFTQLTERLSTSLKKLRGIQRFTEDNIKEAIGDIRKALIEADVALPVVKKFVDDVTEKAIGQTIIKSVRPEEAFVKLVQDELIEVHEVDIHEALRLIESSPKVHLPSAYALRRFIDQRMTGQQR